MAYIYLLDTNILSELVKYPRGKVFDRISSLQKDDICTSIIVACELKFGAIKKKSPQLTYRIQGLLEKIPVLPLTSDIDEYYGTVRDYLESQGTPIGGNDLLIAAHALSLDLIVVTNNMREFNLVPGLRCENWLN